MQNAEYLQRLRREEVCRVKVEIAQSSPFKLSAAGVRAVHENLPQHHFQPANGADVPDRRCSVQGHFVAVHLRSEECGGLLLFVDLVGRRAERAHSCCTPPPFFCVGIAVEFYGEEAALVSAFFGLCGDRAEMQYLFDVLAQVAKAIIRGYRSFALLLLF